ncbi:MAG TPA: PaaI family thioesterase [Dehalococcoidia bacterium]|nr:PaaI family thioesterase [Dehalococcoidia bacterium]
MADAESPRERLRRYLDELPEDRLALVAGWAGSMMRMGTGRPERQPGDSPGPLADLLHIRHVSSGEGRALFELAVEPDLLNPNGVLHGGAVYTMVDYSMGAATMSVVGPGQYCATIEIKMNYLASVRGGVLRCDTHVVKKGRHIVFLASEVRDDAGRLVATATGSFMILSPGT